mmetsp:Transcript_15137/g.25249  ORF Transcript_15137/g.25249 Transcript_15137/m.25249 type:complete len:313 (+) Transcript_15137:1552-2490(+)|eukprot:CAMPEP_0175006566 /NCGR_PEP_ID=MMETSP0005-20121125/5928_1 /TAXON_ID=420556 /ORGANISM="Ochromonas sp., Strain CCMP1393" /LENGTH=312 /DNA_ID=CAMNT_0016261913 /DNA_START=1545 /DNA_END=2483 /DNA_ORIENTATION=+
MKLIIVLSFFLAHAAAFNLPATRIIRRTAPISMSLESDVDVQPLSDIESFCPINFEDNQEKDITSLILPALCIAAPLLISEPALADSKYGIFAGRTASLMHPFTNFALFGTSLYSAYLGLQWRRVRGIGEEIKELNKQLPTLSTGSAKSPVSETIAAISAEISSLADAADADAKISALKVDLASLQGATSIDAQIQELTATRKNLVSMNLKDKHHLTGSILLGAGVTVSILGAFNTYMRAGKLFPGPHLYAGMAITILWAVAASLVPAMQKGNEAARVAHIGANVINIALFAWQIPTGIEIMLKVIEKTSWP